MYRYETHMHTAPVSKCGKATVEESLRFYKEMGYAGVFITNHFIDGNLNIEKERPYEEKLRFYFSGIQCPSKAEQRSPKQEHHISTVFCPFSLISVSPPFACKLPLRSFLPLYQRFCNPISTLAIYQKSLLPADFSSVSAIQ